MTAAVLRPLSLGELLDTSFQVYRRHFTALIPIMLVCYAPAVILQLLSRSVQGISAHPFLWVAALIAVNLFLSALANAATVFVISEGYLGRSISGQEALRRSVPYIGRQIVAMIGFGSLILLGTLLLVIPGIILGCGLTVTLQAIVLENLPTARAGFRRSWELTDGSRGRIFLLWAVLTLIVIMLFAGLGGLLGMLGAISGLTGNRALSIVIGAVGTTVFMLVQIAIYPLFNCVLTILYYDLRVRREGFDLELLATSLQSA